MNKSDKTKIAWYAWLIPPFVVVVGMVLLGYGETCYANIFWVCMSRRLFSDDSLRTFILFSLVWGIVWWPVAIFWLNRDNK